MQEALAVPLLLGLSRPRAPRAHAPGSLPRLDAGLPCVAVHPVGVVVCVTREAPALTTPGGPCPLTAAHLMHFSMQLQRQLRTMPAWAPQG